MADLIDIEFNGQQVDFQNLLSLPLSLRVATDKFFETVGTEGMRVDNAAKKMVIPGTLNNQTIINSLGGVAAPFSIRVNGSAFFNGSAHSEIETKRNGRSNNFSLKLFSNAPDLFRRLGSDTLRGLALGNVIWGQTEIEASWAGTYDGGETGVWGPVLYGQTTDSDNGFQVNDLRFHPYIAAINDAIWKKLGVRVQSTLFDTDFFKKIVYLFGVGNKWSTSGGSAFEILVENTQDQTISNGGFEEDVNFQNEVNDPALIFNDPIMSASPGDWDFSGEFTTLTNAEIRLEINGVLSTVVATSAGQWSFGPVTLTGSPDVKITATQINQVQAAVIGSGSEFRAQKLNVPNVSQTVSVASCLHAGKIIDYLRGISHAFNLAWYYDSVRNVLHVDPRFDFKIGSTWYEGFYKRLGTIGTNLEDWRDKLDQTTFQITSPKFQNWLAFNYLAEDSFHYKRLQETGLVSSNLPFLACRFDIGETGKTGGDSLNPYFENLIHATSATNVEGMPLMIKTESTGGVLPVATYEAGPKLAYYQGDVAGLASWKWLGSLRSNRPALMQKPLPSNPTALDVNISFSDYIGTGSPNFVPGLVRNFFLTWLSTIRKGQIVDGSVALQIEDIKAGPELFQQLKLLTIDGRVEAYVFLGADQFKPFSRQALSKASFLLLKRPDSSDLAAVSSSVKINAIDPD